MSLRKNIFKITLKFTLAIKTYFIKEFAIFLFINDKKRVFILL